LEPVLHLVMLQREQVEAEAEVEPFVVAEAPVVGPFAAMVLGGPEEVEEAEEEAVVVTFAERLSTPAASSQLHQGCH